MSLITLSSNDNTKPYLFSSYFPQPIRIPSGSQVCVLKFIHFRNEETFLINNLNSKLFFCIGNTKNDGKREVVLDNGSYTGDGLAAHLQSKMNQALQQQNYSWVVTYSSVQDQFTIAYISVTTPAETGGTWSDYINDTSLLEITNNDTTGAKSLIEPKLTGLLGEPDSVTAFMKKGILIHEGTFEVEDIGFRVDDTISDPTANIQSKFNETVIGLVRDVISVPYPTQPVKNAGFEDTKQDVNIRLDERGEIQVYTITTDKPSDPSKLNYATPRLMRTVTGAAMDAITQYSLSDKSTVPNIRFKIVTTIVGGSNMRVICQLKVSTDRGQSYVDATTTVNDPSGNPYIRSFTRVDGTVMGGTFWVSNVDDFNDSGSKQNLLITKRCPFVPTISSFKAQEEYGSADLISGDSQSWIGTTETFLCSAYAGANDFNFVLTGSATTYYVRKPASDTSNMMVFKWSPTDSAAPTLQDLTYNAVNGNLVRTDTTPETLSYGGTTLPLFDDVLPKYKTQGIFNGEDRPVTLSENARVSSHQRFNIPDGSTTTSGASATTPLAKTSILYLRKLSQQDIQNYSKTPANLKAGEESGDLGLVIGSGQDNIIVETSSTGKRIFDSTATPDKVAKASTLHISIPELPVRSYEGGYNGIGKNVAVLPREEFKSQNDVSGRLVYVSDFENWLDIESATDLYINQFSVEVRNPDGSLASDLTPDTVLQIKLREDPSKAQRELSTMLKNSLQRTGQILSQDISNVSS